MAEALHRGFLPRPALPVPSSSLRYPHLSPLGTKDTFSPHTCLCVLPTSGPLQGAVASRAQTGKAGALALRSQAQATASARGLHGHDEKAHFVHLWV